MSKVFIPDTLLIWLAGEVISFDEASACYQVRIEDDAVPEEVRNVDMKKLPFGMTQLPLQNTGLPPQGYVYSLFINRYPKLRIRNCALISIIPSNIFQFIMGVEDMYFNSSLG